MVTEDRPRNRTAVPMPATTRSITTPAIGAPRAPALTRPRSAAIGRGRTSCWHRQDHEPGSRTASREILLRGTVRYADGHQGNVPDGFGLRGKDVREQVCDMAANHHGVFLLGRDRHRIIGLRSCHPPSGRRCSAGAQPASLARRLRSFAIDLATSSTRVPCEYGQLSTSSVRRPSSSSKSWRAATSDRTAQPTGVTGAFTPAKSVGRWLGDPERVGPLER
jgi:hypothetical protein